MRAMVLEKQGRVEDKPLRLVEWREPEPEEGYVILKVKACGVCRTDLHIVEGELPAKKLPLIPGHQVVGEAEGRKFGVIWLYKSCSECEYCRRGLENLCERADFTGYTVDGGYAEYIKAPRDFIHPIPSEYPDLDAAPLLCAGVIGYRAFKLSGEGKKLGIYGFGAAAHIITQVAVHKGCDVFVFTRGEAHRRLALKLGAVWAGSAYEIPEKLDRAIIFAPAGELVPLALKALKRGGTLALGGIYMSPIPEMEYSLLYEERKIVSVANTTREDARELLELAPKIPIRTHIEVFPLEEANEALINLKEGRIEGACVLAI